MTPHAGHLAALLRRLEEELLRRDVRRSRAELEARLAPEFLEIGRSGRVYDRDAIVAALAREALSGDAPPVARIEAFGARLISTDVALVTYRSVAVAPVDGPPVDGPPVDGPPGPALRSSIWRRDGGTWRMVFHQGTPAARDEPGGP